MKSIAALAAAGALLAGFPAAALEAISAYSMNDYTVGYARGGAGFACVPRTNLTVTSLGFSGVNITNEPFRIVLWDANGHPLASAVATTNSPILNQTHYERVTPVVLVRGRTYYLSAAGTSDGLWQGDRISQGKGGSFSVASDLSYVGYALGTNSAGAFPSSVGNDTDLYIGPDFLYTVFTGPLISLNRMQWQNGQAQVGFAVNGGPVSSFSLLEAGQPAGPWTTNLTAQLTTNTPGVSYTFTATAGATARFYRVQSP